MANISVLKLDDESRDLCFDEAGDMECLYDAEAIAQNVTNELRAWKGEFPLDLSHGMDWESVVAQPPEEAKAEADDKARTAIFHEPYVQTIDELEITTEERQLSINYTGTLYDGTEIRLEVSKSE